VDNIEIYNDKILNMVSYYLNNCERALDNKSIKPLIDCGLSEQDAFSVFFSAFFDVKDREFEKLYIKNMIHLLSEKEYKNNAYYKNIKFPKVKNKEWELKNAYYSPYELFVKDDFIFKGKQVIPNLGFFNKKFEYPAVFQNDTLWMSVTPNEINTMKEPINNAKGKVLTFGLGLGYFPYMCQLKNNVESVTIVERDKTIIDMFNKYILPQFENKEKISIINEDAYEFLNKMKDGQYDYCFIDIYHDAGDGIDVYLKTKQHRDRLKNTKIEYWIEKTIKYYNYET